MGDHKLLPYQVIINLQDSQNTIKLCIRLMGSGVDGSGITDYDDRVNTPDPIHDSIQRIHVSIVGNNEAIQSCSEGLLQHRGPFRFQ